MFLVFSFLSVLETSTLQDFCHLDSLNLLYLFLKLLIYSFFSLRHKPFTSQLGSKGSHRGNQLRKITINLEEKERKQQGEQTDDSHMSRSHCRPKISGRTFKLPHIDPKRNIFDWVGSSHFEQISEMKPTAAAGASVTQP